MAIRYYLEFITVPVAALVCFLLEPPLGNATLSAAIAGYLLWVFVEYWMHRLVFHGSWCMPVHAIHHRHPFDEAGSPGTVLAHGFLVLAVLAFVSGLGPYLGLPFSGGYLLGYATYIYSHHLIHNGSLSEHSVIRKRHELHHKGWAVNYNMLNPLGDLVFGTYKEPK